jgi:hypothetical protein
MKHCTPRFSFTLLALALVGLTSSAARAVEQPFHLEETGQAVFAPTAALPRSGQARRLTLAGSSSIARRPSITRPARSSR